MTDAIPLCVPHLAGNEAAYLQECIRTNMVSSVGPFVERFEREFAAQVGAEHAVACASGTAALHVALLVAGVVPRDVVAVSTFTFVASANAIAYTGATPLLVDSERETWNVDGARLYDHVRRRAASGRALPRAIEVVHVLGQAADLEPILELRDRYGIVVIEDAAESLGARYRTGPAAGRHVGTVGDLGCFSFNGNKIMTTGGGGMIVTNDPHLARRARHLTTQARLPGIGYTHDEVGYNYRLTNVAAALGVAQLEQLPSFLSAKQAIARRYDQCLASQPVTLPPDPPWSERSAWLYSVLVDLDRSGTEVARQLTHRGIESRPLWTPLHLQVPYAGAPRLGGEVAESLHRRGVSLPCSTGLTEQEQDRAVATLVEILG